MHNVHQDLIGPVHVGCGLNGKAPSRAPKFGEAVAARGTRNGQCTAHQSRNWSPCYCGGQCTSSGAHELQVPLWPPATNRRSGRTCDILSCGWLYRNGAEGGAPWAGEVKEVGAPPALWLKRMVPNGARARALSCAVAPPPRYPKETVSDVARAQAHSCAVGRPTYVLLRMYL